MLGEGGEIRGEGGWPALRVAWVAVLGALAFRGACYLAMTAAAVWNELRPAPPLPDVVLAHVPFVEPLARGNYVLWLVAYLPLALALLWASPRWFARYTVTGGLVSLARGVTMLATGLGPPDPARAGPGLAGRSPGAVFVQLASPWQVFAHGSMSTYLTKDLFFSGHTATTFLLLLYAWRFPRLRAPALVGHAAVVASVFLAHLHYTIDVLGAYAVTYALYSWRERTAWWADRDLAAARAASESGVAPAALPLLARGARRLVAVARGRVTPGAS